MKKRKFSESNMYDILKFFSYKTYGNLIILHLIVATIATFSIYLL